jgi:hypothetical protein
MYSTLHRVDKPIAIVVAATIGLIVLAAGFLAGVPTGEVPPAYAVNCSHGVNYACPGGTTTSALTVSHHTAPSYLGTSTVVEPDDGETWAIRAQWCPTLGGAESTETAYATVSWDGSSWSLSNVTTTANIGQISICDVDSCDAGGGDVHSWSYKLIVDLTDPYPGTGDNLSLVAYTTTSVDDGSLVMDPTETQGDCYLGASVSPTSQTFTGTDSTPYWGINRCPFGCGTPGASVTLLYD